MESITTLAKEEPIGVYTKTIVQSPVVRWILHARLRRRHYNDAVFVGEDFVHVKQRQRLAPCLRTAYQSYSAYKLLRTEPDPFKVVFMLTVDAFQIATGGWLQHIATKTDFDARIRAVSIFQIEQRTDEEDLLVKIEKERAGSNIPGYPPQSLVITLDSNDIVFLLLSTRSDGTYYFTHQTYAIPSFDRLVFQVGAYLAVDPFSRALAAAAYEREVILFFTKPKAQIQDDVKNLAATWCPVATQQPMQIDGIIQQMEFLIPHSEDQDHVILLLIVTDDRSTKAVWIDWYYSLGPHTVQMHRGHPLSLTRSKPNLLIPLRDTSFILATGSELTRWQEITSGSPSAYPLQHSEMAPSFAGVSSCPPFWANWAKPERSQVNERQKESIYLAREDGMVLFLSTDIHGNTEMSLAGDLECHVGSAFASIGDEDGPDLLAVAGDSSSGQVVSIGHWPSVRQLQDLTRDVTMNFVPNQVLPNWASVTDMTSSPQLTSNRAAVSDTANMLLTSGHQPFGNLTEIRRGLEARLSVFSELDGLGNVTDSWALPDTSTGSIIAVLSLPAATRLLSLTAECDELTEIDSSTAFDQSRRTLTCSITAAGLLVQVTSQSICTTGSLEGNFEDTSRETFETENSIILAAAIVPEAALTITAERCQEGHRMSCYRLPSVGSDPGIELQWSIPINGEPLCVSAVGFWDGITAITTTSEGKILVIDINSDSSLPSIFTVDLTSVAERDALCDSASIIQSKQNQSKFEPILAVFGVRDGYLITSLVDLSNSDEPLRHLQAVPLGHSAVKMIQTPSDRHYVYATSGTSTYIVSWDGQVSSNISVENIWVTDRQRPWLAQEPIVAIAEIPAAEYLSSSLLSGNLIMISGDELMIAELDRIPVAVPRQIPLSGSPNRVLYADALKSFVCASLYGEVRLFPSSKARAPPEERRQIWPIIDFIPRRGYQPSFSHHMQPGERVYALLQWTYRPKSEKTYPYVLVGGSYVRRNGNRRGKITFLHPTVRNWEVVDVKSGWDELVDGEVYALGLYDPTTYIACAGEYVRVYRLVEDENKKWESLCRPFKLASPGTHITVENDFSGRRVINITTLRDSLVSLTLTANSDLDRIVEFALIPRATGPRAELLISHFVLNTSSPIYEMDHTDHFALLTTKYGQLIGMRTPKQPTDQAGHAVGQIVFEASVSRSLTRLVQSTAPLRKRVTPSGVFPDRITASATDGAFIGIALIHHDLWRRLAWLQRLVEWSVELSPHLHSRPPYSHRGYDPLPSDSRGRTMPIGCAGRPGDDIVMYTENSRPNDMHINGDILGRVLQAGGVEAVIRVLRNLLETHDGIGQWLKAGHGLDAEIFELYELVEVVKRLEAWM